MSIASTQALPSSLSVTDAISRASQETGVDFRFLLDTAKRESSLDPSAKSTTSSATGLFQFLDQTWLATLKAHGGEHGLQAQADLINEDTSGRLSVADPAQKSAILALRTDPRISALMAGELSRDSRSELQNLVGRPVGNGELYLAHFLGPREAARFLGAAGAAPNAPAAESFPEAAGANRAVFYDRDGSARTFAEVKAALTGAPGSGSQDAASNSAPPAPGDVVSSLPQLSLPNFSADNDDENESGAAPAQPFTMGALMPAMRLTPQIFQILASLDPFGGSREEPAFPNPAAGNRAE